MPACTLVLGQIISYVKKTWVVGSWAALPPSRSAQLNPPARLGALLPAQVLLPSATTSSGSSSQPQPQAHHHHHSQQHEWPGASIAQAADAIDAELAALPYFDQDLAPVELPPEQQLLGESYGLDGRALGAGPAAAGAASTAAAVAAAGGAGCSARAAAVAGSVAGEAAGGAAASGDGGAAAAYAAAAAAADAAYRARAAAADARMAARVAVNDVRLRRAPC
jgi:hypothetical protein